MSKKTADCLRKAKALIEDKEHWTTGTYARDKREVPVHALSPEAVKFCALGACLRVGCDFAPLLSIVRNEVAWLNDHQGHEAVMSLFDKAIAAEEQA